MEGNQDKETPIQAYSKWTLRQMYGIGDKAFNEWIKPFEEDIGKQRGRKYTPAQVKIIFEKLGTP